jgi:hypothetical protein
MVQGPKIYITAQFLSAGMSKRGRAEDGPGPEVSVHLPGRVGADHAGCAAGSPNSTAFRHGWNTP